MNYSENNAHQPLMRVTRTLFERELVARQEEATQEVLAYLESASDDIFFTIADQVLNKAVRDNIEDHLRRLVAQADYGTVNPSAFEQEIVNPILAIATKIIAELEGKYFVDLSAVHGILRNPEYRSQVIKLVKEKLDVYLQAFRRRGVDIAEMYGNHNQSFTGAAYEDRVCTAFEKSGWIAHKTPATGDQGADLICTKAGTRLVIQCKFYSGNVGNAAVQEAHAAKSFYDASHAAVISNAGFTRSAIELAEKLGVLLVPDEQLESFVQG